MFDVLSLAYELVILRFEFAESNDHLFHVRSSRGDVSFEGGDDGGGFTEEFLLDELCFEAGLTVAEVFDEFEEFRDVRGFRLDLGGGAREVDAEGAVEDGGFLGGGFTGGGVWGG